MGFVASSDIHAYPVASRGAGYPYSRISTEYNLTQGIRAISSKDGFVVSPANQVLTKIAFVVGGYYFEADATAVKNSADIASFPATVYATIVLSGDEYKRELSQQSSGEQITSTDADKQFTGVSFSTSKSSDGISIPILYCTSASSYTVKEEYRYRVDRDDVELVWEELPQETVGA